MTDWIALTNFGIVCAGLLVAIIGLILTIASPYMEKVSRRLFLIFFPLLIAYIFSDLISQISLDHTSCHNAVHHYHILYYRR